MVMRHERSCGQVPCRPALQAWLALLLLLAAPVGVPGAPTLPKPRGSGFTYQHEEVPDKPWSIHILKVDRSRRDLGFQTLSAGGTSLGLAPLTDQLKAMPQSAGQAVAAINGDFWRESSQVNGDPMGLQIRSGELVSAPGERSCFWIDASGAPQMGVVRPQFAVTWADGSTLPFGLNEERTNGGAVLYTAAAGASTRTQGGRELVLERDGDGPWLPLRAGQKLPARIRALHATGDTPLAPDTLVLSLSPAAAGRLPPVARGSRLTLETATVPDLGGVTTALGGGPALVRDGKPVTFTGSQPRHPRTALGWNDTHLFLVVVDGRQLKLSVGMSFPELAEYLLKLGCRQALNLDGGGSSTFWVHGQVMNSPCYGKERPMANALVLVRRPPAAEPVTGGPR